MPSLAPRPTRNTAARHSLNPEVLAEIVALLDTVEPNEVVVLDDRFGPDAGKNGGQGVARSRATLALAEIENQHPNYKNYLRTHAVEVEAEFQIWAPALSVREKEKQPRKPRTPKTEAPAETPTAPVKGKK